MNNNAFEAWWRENSDSDELWAAYRAIRNTHQELGEDSPSFKEWAKVHYSILVWFEEDVQVMSDMC